MTAEIAVMNKSGVALAADSAVTITSSNGHKVLNTANKLFMLSKFQPVGVMVYGNAMLTGTPWEILVKQFRSDLGSNSFDTLHQYADAFFSFIEARSGLVTPSDQRAEVAMHAWGHFEMIRDEIIDEIKQETASGSSVSLGKIKSIATSAIRDRLSDLLANTERLDGFDDAYAAAFMRRYRSLLDRCVEDVFERLPVGKVSAERLRKLICEFFMRDVFPVNVMSGVVIAGYGAEEIYPSVYSYDIQSMVEGRMKKIFRPAKSCEIGEGSGRVGVPAAECSVTPFAQSDMVSLFMEGVDPDYRMVIESALDGFVAGLPKLLANAAPVPPAQQQAYEAVLGQALGSVLSGLSKELHTYRQRHHVDPVVAAVGVLGKEELAEMAESLVSLTSFKRRVTLGTETVGGPIDVAVISKGDGFVWIKRKHYFDPDLNHHFKTNYFRS